MLFSYYKVNGPLIILLCQQAVYKVNSKLVRFEIWAAIPYQKIGINWYDNKVATGLNMLDHYYKMITMMESGVRLALTFRLKNYSLNALMVRGERGNFTEQ